jgi:hypothetical protein
MLKFAVIAKIATGQNKAGDFYSPSNREVLTGINGFA